MRAASGPGLGERVSCHFVGEPFPFLSYSTGHSQMFPPSSWGSASRAFIIRTSGWRELPGLRAGPRTGRGTPPLGKQFASAGGYGKVPRAQVPRQPVLALAL